MCFLLGFFLLKGQVQACANVFLFFNLFLSISIIPRIFIDWVQRVKKDKDIVLSIVLHHLILSNRSISFLLPFTKSNNSNFLHFPPNFFLHLCLLFYTFSLLFYIHIVVIILATVTKCTLRNCFFFVAVPHFIFQLFA